MTSSPAQHYRCLRDAVTLLEGVENRITDLDVGAIDSALAYQKGAIGRCGSIVQCQCEGYQERAVLLTFIIDKLSLCESIVQALLKQIQRPEEPQQLRTPFHFQIALEHSNRTCQTLFFGDYEIEYIVEWASLIRGLICIQLSSQAHFLAEL